MAAAGLDGAPYRVRLERDGTAHDVKEKETLRLQAGDVVVIDTCGGGGYGDPAARVPELQAGDRREGYALARQDGRWRIFYEVHGGGEGAGAQRPSRERSDRCQSFSTGSSRPGRQC